MDEDQRRAIRIEIAIVLVVTFGLSGASALLALIEGVLQGLAQQQVALNPSRSTISLIDLLYQLLSVLRLLGWAGLAVYLLWRSGIGPRTIGLGRPKARVDLPPGLGLAALIGLPGLALYLVAHQLGMSVTLIPASIHDHWWRVPVLILAAIANAGAEEIVVVGYLLTRLRQLDWSPNRALAASALLRGSYHLYQGFGGGVGNVVMGAIFGRYWQWKQRLWPPILAHATIDSVAYLGYLALHGHVSWLP